jgi:arabinose-5-phosphate isomerase
MSKSPKTIDENKFAVEALNVMKENHITQLIVTNEKKEYKGIVHLHDLIREGII